MMKFWALIVSSDLSLKRMWIDNTIVINMLKEQPNLKIYRITNDQEAILSEGILLWRDIPNE